jgi:xylulokinase
MSLLLGIDLGTSFVKVSVVDPVTLECVASSHFPETESPITSIQKGWAEQDPADWWEHVKKAILKCNASKKYQLKDIIAIGISYQMHGLVLVDKNQQVLRPSIIWCDSRAVEIGNTAFEEIGTSYCLDHLLNSPGNFTASKLAWVKQHEPAIFSKVNKAMLPGDFIAMKLTGEISSSIEGLSEGIFWDFKDTIISKDILRHFKFEEHLFPSIKEVFSVHGGLINSVAHELSLTPNIPVSYKAGDQPNNALSLNVLEPGEIAAAAGTSGVIYGVSDKLIHDHQSRINTFAHVNYTKNNCRVGVLLCINGAGILNKWIRNITAPGISYAEINQAIEKVEPGANGLRVLPFGNGAERMLNNKVIGSHFSNIDLNIHTKAHLYRGVQEGIAFAFRYGLDIMRENGLHPSVIRAGQSNLFLSVPFVEAFVNATDTPVQLFDCDGSVGAAIGAGIGAGIFTAEEAFKNLRVLKTIEPRKSNLYETFYGEWKTILEEKLKTI